MNPDLKVPHFNSEAEEAQWWFDHREQTASLLEEAAEQGKTTKLAAILEKKRAAAGPTPTVSIRIDPADLTRARIQAERRGLRYQTYLKMVLHEALEQEDQRTSR
jgi:predicted DNA binding CopG/RHH family protein